VPAAVHKSAVPTVCFVGRLDRRKRPDAVLELARDCPHIRFVIAGRSQHARYGSALADACRGLPNVTATGFIDQFQSAGLSRVLGESWILVNTSAREGLPNAFIEACAHRCAILSAVDPDGFASRFGAHVPDRDFRRGLRELLDGDRWRERGEAGCRYVSRTNEADAATTLHLAVYDRCLRGEPA
jgi:glycosyltransferase involved in cell wall biosynthesis